MKANWILVNLCLPEENEDFVSNKAFSIYFKKLLLNNSYHVGKGISITLFGEKH